MRKRPGASVAANPVLIGAATTLVLIVAVFLAYNANNGLPFVPSYQLKAQVPDAAQLVKGNDVRLGGARVGVVDAIDPVFNKKTGAATALLTLKLQTSVKPLPKDSTILVRPRSALGLKYVEITRGGNPKQVGGYADGDTMPLSRATPKPVEIDQVFNTFDTKTRAAQQVNLREFGNALVGRGQDLNVAIQALNPLLRNLVPVMTNLARKQTGLAQFVQALGRTSRIVAPAAETQAQLFDNLDTTFSALSNVARPYIQDTITNGVRAEDASIRAFPVIRPFLANTQGLFHELRPGVKALAPAANALGDAFVIGTPTLRRSVALDNRLKPLLQSLQDFSTDPLVPLAVKDLTRTVNVLAPPIDYLAPTQTVCNYVSLWFRNVSSLLSEGDSNGTWQRFIIIATPQGPNNEGGPSSAPADGPTSDNHLHANPYPNANASECEAGNEKYLAGKTVLTNPAGSQGTQHDVTVRDPSQ